MAAERIRMIPEAPPAWAEALLRLFVTPSSYDNVTGDLLEEYRESVLPTRGQRRADLWYVMQVLGFMSRGAGLWVALFGTAFIARTAMDWLVPTDATNRPAPRDMKPSTCITNQRSARR